ncbi:hypothetical protein ACTFIR_005588 [Dictyostelium discoideum]
MYDCGLHFYFDVCDQKREISIAKECRLCNRSICPVGHSYYTPKIQPKSGCKVCCIASYHNEREIIQFHDDIYHLKKQLLLFFKSGDNIFYTSRMDCTEGSMDTKVQRCMDALRYIYYKSFENIGNGDQQNKIYYFDYVYDLGDENRIKKSHTGYITPSLLESINNNNNNNMEFININLDKYINSIYEIISIIMNKQSSRKPCIFGIGNSNEFSTIISIPHDGNHYLTANP